MSKHVRQNSANARVVCQFSTPASVSQMRTDALAQRDFIRLAGHPAMGFVSPAWQLPIPSTELESFRFVMRFRALESCKDPEQVQRLATWSWDCVRLGSMLGEGRNG